MLQLQGPRTVACKQVPGSLLTAETGKKIGDPIPALCTNSLHFIDLERCQIRQYSGRRNDQSCGGTPNGMKRLCPSLTGHNSSRNPMSFFWPIRSLISSKGRKSCPSTPTSSLWCLSKGKIHPNYLLQLKYWKPLRALNRQCLCWFSAGC